MPFAGLGLHILLALLCAVHVVRSGQPLYWLFILFAFPLLGSLVYFFAVFLPASRLERGAMKAVSAAARAIDPQRDVRAARAEYEQTPTVQNQMRLAAALLDTGEAEESARLYAAGLQGPFAEDPEMRLGAARACVECQRFAEALPHVQAVQASRPDYRPDTAQLLLARALAGAGQATEAREAFERAIERHGTFEAHAEYQIWALATGDSATAARLQTQIDRMMSQWNPMSRELNAEPLRRLRAAQQLARSRSG